MTADRRRERGDAGTNPDAGTRRGDPDPVAASPRHPASVAVSPLFERLCEVGNALEDIRNTTYLQGALRMLLDGILTALDVVIDTLVEAPAGGGCARHTARAGEEET
jgi:hypothetical protein